MANPSPEIANLKPFEPGQSGNPGGKSTAQRKAEVEAAEDAAKLRALMTKRLLERAAAGEDVSDMIEPATLRLLKDSEDRAFGLPSQPLEHSNPDGSFTLDPKKLTLEQRKAILAAQVSHEPDADAG